MTLATPARVVLVAGLHGPARARAVEELLRGVPGSVAIHHDLHRITEGTAYRVVRDRWGQREHTRIDLVHGCVSCTLREDLVPLLVGLAEAGEHRLLIVEAWDGVEPRAISEALALTRANGRPVARWLRLAAVLTAVSAHRLVEDLACSDFLDERALAVADEDDRTIAEVLAHQVEYPAALTVDGSVADPGEIARAEALLAQLNPAAALLPLECGSLAALADGTFDVQAAAARTDLATATPLDSCAVGEVRTVTWRRSRPLHPGRLHAVLDDVVATSLRSRGRFWLANRPDTMLVWDAAGATLSLESAGPWLAALPDGAWNLASAQRQAVAALDWAPDRGDRCQCLSFTGIGMDTDRIVKELDSCLVSAEEFTDSRADPAWDDPFAAVLDDAD